MSEQPQIRFEDGAAYETYMGVWSRKVGEDFLDWLQPPPGVSWVDVGCGNGAFTALLAERVSPSGLLGVDPSPAQLDFARKRSGVEVARFESGHAMDLPAAENSADAAVMALVIAFVPDPAKGVAEMARVVKPGGLVSAYMWDWPSGFPFHFADQAIESRGLPRVAPPSWEASHLDQLEKHWREAGLTGVESRVITVARTFPDFETLWAITLTGPRMTAAAQALTPELRGEIAAELKEKLGVAEGEPITLSARANAIKGKVPR
ncbi:class I SAM-dependent methyltransferase [Aestuariivirga sp.]|uniref:class I SAM-dependent methyltransferase n=1 Tax=Aestuariivirga sp. TaxID=2650926 RepID=UPI003BAC092B